MVMGSNEVKSYDELNIFEKEIIDTIRQFQLEKNHAKLSLYSFKLDDLLKDYDELINLRKSIQMKYFSIFNEIKNEKLVDGEINSNLWYYNRENEDNIWKEELNVLGLIKNTIDENIKLIESGNAEKIIIENENKI